MLDQTLHAGAPYSVRVKTSADVTAINVSAMGQTYGMQGAGPGLFASDGQVPGGIPFFLLNRDYTRHRHPPSRRQTQHELFADSALQK